MRTVPCRLLMAAVAAWSCTALIAQSEIEVGSYTYDDSGNITSIRNAGVLTSTYAYDTAGRMIRFTETDMSGAVIREETFEYDGYGNRTAHTTDGSRKAYPAAADTNRLVDATYSTIGDVTQHGGESYTYDPVGTLTTRTGSGGTAFYIYSADDERVGIGVDGTNGRWRFMARSLDDKVLREWSSTTWNGNWFWIEDYVYRNGLLAAAERPVAQGGIRHFHLDHLGSPRVISNQDKALYAEHRYAPFGNEITDPAQEIARGHDSPEPMKFTGHERDLTGPEFTGPALDYMHARYYKPDAGRFLSVDPVLDIKRALGDPLRWNGYAYVRNRPLISTDPTGRIIWDQLDDAAGKEQLRQQLEQKTGLKLVYKDGQLQATGEIITDANGQQIGSATARADLQKALAPGVTFIMRQTTNTAHGMAVQEGVRTFINFNKMRQVSGGNRDGGTFDFAMIVMHELLGHGVNGLHDNYSRTNPSGDTVDYENKIRRELGITNERLEYETQKDGSRYYLKFTNGRVWVPKPPQ
ncbi:MAG TPA: RHS repeat-associated core domain-containing protein [Thermoanaerobaculia bacterium]|nr:RHS repeat-associated core domain-containing protein [Thermoanaerobaculia bacterium]